MTISLRAFAFSGLAAAGTLLSASHALGQEADRPPNAVEPVAAPDSLPFRAGQWGAEFFLDDGTSGVGVLRFRTPHRAWLLDGSFFASWREDEGSVFDQSGTSAFVRVRAGPRRYRPIAAGAASYVGFGLTAAYGWSGADGDNRRQFWDAGVFGDFGGVYFVTRRLSLGAQIAVYGTFNVVDQRSSDPIYASRSRGVELRLSPVRIVGGLYF